MVLQDFQRNLKLADVYSKIKSQATGYDRLDNDSLKALTLASKIMAETQRSVQTKKNGYIQVC